LTRTYAEKLAYDSSRAGERRRAFQDIEPGYPAAGDIDRRDMCERDLRQFFERYFPGAFRLAWSPDHLKVIARIEEAVLDRSTNLFSLAMPRGGGKTTCSIRAAIWALLYGHRRFVVLLASTEGKAVELIEDLKSELLYNDLLAEDFRQVCYPVRRLDGNARKAAGQLFGSERTAVVWGAKRVVFPTMPDSACDGANVSGSVVAVAGLTGAIRGMKHTLATGEVIRPDFCLLDDPQTRESAESVEQTRTRIRIVQGDVLGMAGPTNSLSVVMPCTVVRGGDLSDTMLDRERSPAWQGIRTKAVVSWPERMDLWDRYRDIRAECKRRDLPTAEATEFYKANREEMDRGGQVAWEARREAGDLSGLQHMMHKLFDLGEAAFMAELQNEPLREEVGPTICVPQADIQAKVNGVPHRAVPLGAQHLTAAIDVHDALLYWCVCAWSSEFTGWVLDYGCYPEQSRRVFSLRRASPTLADKAPGAGREGAIHAGLTALAERLMTRQWKREDGVEMKVERGLVDSGYEPTLVHDFCRRSEFAANLMPSRGLGIGAKRAPMEDWLPKQGERKGHGWVMGKSASRAVRVVRFDANLWKSFLHARLAMAVGDRGSLTLYGKSPEHHQLFAEHLSAERPVEVSASGRTALEWEMRPEATDNHFLDVTTQAAVAASTLGCQLPAMGPGQAAGSGERKRVSWSAMQEAARARR
jgi:hypothetical protein